MKKNSIMAIMLLVALCQCNTKVPKKIDFASASKIPIEKAKERTISNKLVKSLSVKSLKDGNNYLDLPSGNKFVVKLSGVTISTILFTDSTGNVLEVNHPGKKKSLNNSIMFFECGSQACICDGDADCNDMFENGPCGLDAICIEGDNGRVVCVCFR